MEYTAGFQDISPVVWIQPGRVPGIFLLTCWMFMCMKHFEYECGVMAAILQYTVGKYIELYSGAVHH